MRGEETVTEKEYTCLMTHVLDLGEAMLKCGAEVSRVEDSLRRIFASYGAKDTDELSITSSIVLTVTFSEGVVLTQTRRIRSVKIDFSRLSAYNALSRHICEERPAPEEIRRALERIEEERLSGVERAVRECVGTVCATGGFAVFFGGGARFLRKRYGSNDEKCKKNVNLTYFLFQFAMDFGIIHFVSLCPHILFYHTHIPFPARVSVLFG